MGTRLVGLGHSPLCHKGQVESTGGLCASGQAGAFANAFVAWAYIFDRCGSGVATPCATLGAVR